MSPRPAPMCQVFPRRHQVWPARFPHHSKSPLAARGPVRGFGLAGAAGVFLLGAAVHDRSVFFFAQMETSTDVNA